MRDSCGEGGMNSFVTRWCHDYYSGYCDAAMRDANVPRVGWNSGSARFFVG